MNRLEVIPLFTALQVLLETQNYEGALKVVNTTLTEALLKGKSEPKKEEE